MKKVVLLISISIFLFLLSGCSFQQIPKLDNVVPEKPYYDYDDNIEINFNIINDGKTTFNPKIEVLVNETCFYENGLSNLASISPGGKSFEKISINSRGQTSCKNSEQKFTILLKDKFGKEIIDEVKNIKISIRN